VNHHISDRPSTPPERRRERLRFNQPQKLLQGPLSWSTNAKEVFTQSRPYVQLDQPDIVINGIREVSDQTR